MKKQKKHRLERLRERTRRRHEARAANFSEQYVGVLRTTVSGYGFVVPSERCGRDGGDAPLPSEIFIPPRELGGAIDGDRVRVGILPPEARDAGRGPAGRVIEVLQAAREKIVGELLAGRKVRPLNIRIGGDVEISGRSHGAKRGDWVEIRLDRHSDDGDDRGSALRGTITARIGKAGTVQGDLDAVAREYQLPEAYSEAENAEAEQLSPREIPREDCRKLVTVTIDPFDAKDFDDALSLRTIDRGHWEVGVHISDVAGWIVPGTRADRQAARRGFTTYLPGRTMPMLPAKLTARISMGEDRDAPAHSVFFTVDASDFSVLSVRRCHTLVRIRHRMNYDEVQEFLDGGKAPERWSAACKRTVKRLAAIAEAWRAKRRADEAFLDMEIPEVRVLCDEAGDTVNGFETRVQRDSEALVEEFMLAANTAVAEELTQKNVPALFRVHAEPDPEKLAEFEILSEESCNIPTGDLTLRSNVCEYLRRIEKNPRKVILLNALLRSMPRAGYSAECLPHYGLGKKRYCHFTSPIRRYADLTVHQQLWNLDSGKRLKDKGTLMNLSERLDFQEENSDNAYFAACDRLKLRWLDEQLEQNPESNFCEGLIAKVVSAGLSVYIPELGLYGFVPSERLQKRRRFGDRGGAAPRYQVGDVIYLKLLSVEIARGSAIFTPC